MEWQNDSGTLGDSLVISDETKYTLSIRSNNCYPWYLPKLRKKLMSTKKPAHGCFIATLLIIAKTWNNEDE